MVYDMWKFDDSLDMIKQTYVIRLAWNGKQKVNGGNFKIYGTLAGPFLYTNLDAYGIRKKE